MEKEELPWSTQSAITPSKDPLCGICLTGKDYAELFCDPCNHSFHAECITKWFKTLVEANTWPSCPYCRKDVLATKP